MLKKVVLYVLWLIAVSVNVKGQLVVEETPCKGQAAQYRCTVSGEDLEWRWTPLGRLPVDYIIVPLLNLQDRISTLTTGDTKVMFNVTDFNASYISSVAVVNYPETLNGTKMTCNGQNLTISVPGTSLLPTALRVMRPPDNGSEVSIQPIVEGDTVTTSYQLSSSDTRSPWTGSTILPVPDDITFFHCQYNVTFIIDSCILDDELQERNYTLFTNNTWAISTRCGPAINVTCNDRRWSEDISCPRAPPVESSASSGTDGTGQSSTMATIFPFVWIGVGIGIILALILFILVILVTILCIKKNMKQSNSLEDMELNHLEEDANEYSTLNHPTPARSMMPADAYDTINIGFSAGQPLEAPLHGVLNGNAATDQDITQNQSGQDRLEHRGEDRAHGRFQDRAQDTHSDTTSHQYSKTKHITQKSKSNDMIYSEVAMGDQATLYPHPITESGVHYSGIRHGVRPEDVSLNLDTLLIQLGPVTDQYQELGVAAGLSQETIEEITSHAAVAFDGLVEVCDAWIWSLRRQDTAPTWRAVSDMLQKIGQEKLARDLLKVYMTGSLPVMVDMHTVEIPKQATQSLPPPVPQRNDADMDEEGEVAMATVVSIRRDRAPSKSVPLFHPNDDQAMAVPPGPSKKRAPQPGAPAIPPQAFTSAYF